MSQTDIDLTSIGNQQFVPRQEAITPADSAASSSLNCLSRAITNISQKVSHARANIATYVNCNRNTLLTASAVTGVSLLLLAPEAFFITGAYYCFNDPQVLRQWCGIDRQDSEQEATSRAVGYTIGSTLYACTLCITVFQWRSKRFIYIHRNRLC